LAILGLDPLELHHIVSHVVRRPLFGLRRHLEAVVFQCKGIVVLARLPISPNWHLIKGLGGALSLETQARVAEVKVVSAQIFLPFLIQHSSESAVCLPHIRKVVPMSGKEVIGVFGLGMSKVEMVPFQVSPETLHLRGLSILMRHVSVSSRGPPHKVVVSAAQLEVRLVALLVAGDLL